MPDWVAGFFADLVGRDAPVAFAAYDGSRAGPEDAPGTVVVRSPNALRRLATAPNELGLARAYVTGEIDLEGDVFYLYTPFTGAVLAAVVDRLERLPRPIAIASQTLDLARHSWLRDLARPCSWLNVYAADQGIAM